MGKEKFILLEIRHLEKILKDVLVVKKYFIIKILRIISMTKICENCPYPMIWNDLKQRWDCKTCGYSEGSAFEGHSY